MNGATAFPFHVNEQTAGIKSTNASVCTPAMFYAYVLLSTHRSSSYKDRHTFLEDDVHKVAKPAWKFTKSEISSQACSRLFTFFQTSIVQCSNYMYIKHNYCASQRNLHTVSNS